MTVTTNLPAEKILVMAFDARPTTAKLEARIASLESEISKLKKIIAYIDTHAPLADATCAEPGITLSEAAARALEGE